MSIRIRNSGLAALLLLFWLTLWRAARPHAPSVAPTS